MNNILTPHCCSTNVVTSLTTIPNYCETLATLVCNGYFPRGIPTNSLEQWKVSYMLCQRNNCPKGIQYQGIDLHHFHCTHQFCGYIYTVWLTRLLGLLFFVCRCDRGRKWAQDGGKRRALWVKYKVENYTVEQLIWNQRCPVPFPQQPTLQK